ncbi:MAG: hypothetical protein MI739_11210 [Bacteroidales bacterium]|nr:hypothetical protein [Bacteroidales bacterium]
MDYKGGTELWKHQWKLAQDPQKILFAWAQKEEEGAFRRNACRKYFGQKFSELQKRNISIQGQSYLIPEPTSEECDKYKSPIEYWLSIDNKAVSSSADELYDNNGNTIYRNAWIEANSPYTCKGLTITGKGESKNYFGVISNVVFKEEIGNSSTYEIAVSNWKSKKYPNSTQVDWVNTNHVESLAKAILKDGELNFAKIHGTNKKSLYYIKYHTENQKIYYNEEELMYFYWGYVANRNFNFSMPDEAAAFACAFLNKETFEYPSVNEFEIAPWNMKALLDGWTFSMKNKRWSEEANKDIDMYLPYKISADYLPEGLSVSDAIELVLWIAPGTAAAKKITLKIGSQMLLAAYIDWQLQIFINMLDGKTFKEAVALVKYDDVLWSGITAPIADFKTKAGFACVRAAVSEIKKNKEVSFNTGLVCLTEILQEALVHKMFSATNSPYNIALANIFKGKTRGQIIDRLKSVGLSQNDAYAFMDMLPAIITSKIMNNE